MSGRHVKGRGRFVDGREHEHRRGALVVDGRRQVGRAAVGALLGRRDQHACVDHQLVQLRHSQ